MSLFTNTYKVVWSEVDLAGVVHFSNYFKYCENLEQEFLYSIGINIKDFVEKFGVWFPRVMAKCEYKSPLRYGDSFRVDLEDIILGNSSIRFKYRIWNLTENKLSANCEIVVACIRISDGKTISIPDELRNMFEKILSKIKK
jgi:acyl-CoA thioester hydrolase